MCVLAAVKTKTENNALSDSRQLLEIKQKFCSYPNGDFQPSKVVNRFVYMLIYVHSQIYCDKEPAATPIDFLYVLNTPMY